jgi:hypothetical protein
MAPGVEIVVLGAEYEFGPVVDSDVVFLPSIPDAAMPGYPGDVPKLIEQLRLSGVTSRTWHPGDQCTFVSGRSILTETVLQLVVGVASSAGLQAIRSLIRGRSGTVRVTVVFDRDGERLRATVEGKAGRVVAELAAIDPFRPESSE